MTREQAERLYGPINTVCQYPPIPMRNFDWCAYFDNLIDLDCPSWIQASGETEAEALDNLLEQAEEHTLDAPDFTEGLRDLDGVIRRILGEEDAPRMTESEKIRRINQQGAELRAESDENTPEPGLGEGSIFDRYHG